MKSSSVIDLPKLFKGNDDLLGTSKYISAIKQFIERTETPITIALQGEWGSGKTSMMYSLQNELCENSKFYGIWINTWQYSILSSDEIVVAKLINGIIGEIDKVTGFSNSNKFFEKAKSIGVSLIKFGLRLGVEKVAGQAAAEGADSVVDAFLQKSVVKELRLSLEEAIQKNLEIDKKKKGFIFFIDDLDRIEPVIAVQILEILKNIFDIENCVFVLAIDYDVVVKGLKPKFGELTEKNEREFRSFFDKIIQLPFTLPVNNYGVNDFIRETFGAVGYLTPEEMSDEKMINSIATITNLSVGKNPRSLKRLTNSLSLIKIINELDKEKDEANNEKYEKIINIALVSIQIAYNFIYQLLNDQPNFKLWDWNFAKKHRLPELDDKTLEIIKNSEKFDEVWEQVLYCACLKDNYLKNNAYNISSLLNEISNHAPKNELGEVISDIIELSSITDVEASANNENKQNRKSSFSTDIGNFNNDELKLKLIETFSIHSGNVKRLYYLFELLLSKKDFITREDIKKYFFKKGEGESEGHAGRYLSNVSQFFTKTKNSHLRQLVSFKTGGGQSGQQKDNYYLNDEYRDLVSEVLTNLKEKILN